MDELQAGVEFALAVLPEAAAFLYPGKGSLDDPALRHDGKGMQLTALSDLNFGTEQFFYGMGKRLPDVSAVGQNALNGL